MIENKRYIYIAYAKNENGIKFGDDAVVFTANEEGSSTIEYEYITDSRDDKTYKTVKIGEQWWMGENLAYLPKVNPISDRSDNYTYYYVYDYDGTNVIKAKETDNYKTYGVICNWLAAMEACPNGWRLPSHDDWEQLSSFISEQKGPYGKNGLDWYGVGNHLKSKGNLADGSGMWKKSNPEQVGTDDYGFSGLPCGYFIEALNHFHGKNIYASWWSSTEYNKSQAYYRYISYQYDEFQVQYQHAKKSGYSVRCIKD